ncbi:hypothetical protein [Streptomyces sp. WAC06128]|uniref:hypothetical protein n=1 Tax=Streptomyces sp. WAC06128 TaxID=2487426 RepID=UPI00163B68C7|nr:hypothetical protein [Streptomyces sp. WAC06128]
MEQGSFGGGLRVVALLVLAVTLAAGPDDLPILVTLQESYTAARLAPRLRPFVSGHRKSAQLCRAGHGKILNSDRTG